MMQLSMFSPRGGRRVYPRQLVNLEKLGFNSLPIHVKQFCVQNLLGVPVIFEIFSLKHIRSRPCVKVLCLIPEGSDCFCSLIPRVSLPPHLWGKSIILIETDQLTYNCSTCKYRYTQSLNKLMSLFCHLLQGISFKMVNYIHFNVTGQ